MDKLLMTLRCFVPQLLSAESTTENNSVPKLIVMGVVLVVFVIIFVLISKKLKNKK